MAKIYIDCGAWTGDSVLEFKNKYNNEFKVYAFECHPKHKKELIELSKEKNFIFLDKAVWIKDEPIKLYLGVDNFTQSSTLHSDKKKFIKKDFYVSVEGIDFSNWVSSNFNLSDYIICKMNIEGAEYEVLEKMIKDETIDLIDKLYISWHYKKLMNFPKIKHTNLLKELEQRIDIVEWNFDENNLSPFI